MGYDHSRIFENLVFHSGYKKTSLTARLVLHFQYVLSKFIKITHKFSNCFGRRDLFIISNYKFSLRKGFFCLYDKKLIWIVRDTVIRDKGDPKPNAGKINQKIIAAQFDFRNEIQLMLLK